MVAAVTAPVIAHAKHESLVTKSLSNLHQMQVGLQLYRTEYDGDAKYGALSEMGLPPAEFVMLNRFGMSTSMWASPCGQNPNWESVPTVIQYDYLPDSGLDYFPSIAGVYQDGITVFSDMNCADHGDPLYSNYVDHLGLGVTLAGNLIKKRKAGDARFQVWWARP